MPPSAAASRPLCRHASLMTKAVSKANLIIVKHAQVGLKTIMQIFEKFNFTYNLTTSSVNLLECKLSSFSFSVTHKQTNKQTNRHVSNRVQTGTYPEMLLYQESANNVRRNCIHMVCIQSEVLAQTASSLYLKLISGFTFVCSMIVCVSREQFYGRKQIFDPL